MRPSILVLDEPTSFLDPKSAEEIVSVLAKLGHDLGLTILLVEHRLDIVSRHANRVIVMDGGKIQLDGPPREVYNDQARLIGIGLPRVTMLCHLLRKDGFSVSNPITVEEASNEIRRLMTK